MNTITNETIAVLVEVNSSIGRVKSCLSEGQIFYKLNIYKHIEAWWDAERMRNATEEQNLADR